MDDDEVDAKDNAQDDRRRGRRFVFLLLLAFFQFQVFRAAVDDAVDKQVSKVTV